MAQRFDRIASSYWLFEKLFMVPKRARTRAVELLHLEIGDRVLSVGCGHGPDLPDLSKAVGPAGLVVGVDLSSGMLQGSRSRIMKAKLTNVELVHCDVQRYTSAHPFDAVLFPFSLTSTGDPATVLHHVWTLLAPGGRSVVLDAQIPPRLEGLIRPVMPLLRRFMEATVLGDPDMRPIEELGKLGSKVDVEWMRGGTYFLATLIKPE